MTEKEKAAHDGNGSLISENKDMKNFSFSGHLSTENAAQNYDSVDDSAIIHDAGDDIKVTWYEMVTAEGQPSTLNTVFEMIKNGEKKKAIENLRKAKHQGDEILAGKIKNKLPAFTPSGEFKSTHRKEDLIQYNHIVILDIDKVGCDFVSDLKGKAIGINLTFAAFISPSGDGLKILVRTDSMAESHEHAFNQIAAYYEGILGVQVDKSGKDLSRLCFLSYDPDLYLNEEADIFHMKKEISVPVFTEPARTGDLSELFKHTVSFTSKIMPFQNGNRNNFIYLLANNLNRVGIDKATAESFIRGNYTDPDLVKEIPTSINSAYTHVDEHGIWEPEYISSVISVKSVTAVTPHSTIGSPFIPDEVYANLPDLLKRCTQVFELRREKDIILTGTLTILSGCFHNVKGIYDRREFGPNLFCFVIAPPASGKGVLIYAKTLAQWIHEKIMEEFENHGGRDRTPMPRCHFIPADSSAAAVKGNLKLNNGQGTICETEAETFSSTIQQEWGQYSDLVRKASQHEPVTFSRLDEKGKPKTEEIIHPELSMCLSGTPSQIPVLIKGIEDGLLSRIMFYYFRIDGVPTFKDVFPEEGLTNLSDYFRALSKEVYNDYYIKCRDAGRVIFDLSKHQKKIFVERFDRMVKKTYLLFGEDTNATVFRLGLIAFRISMILTILRKIEKNELAGHIECEDVDFETSLILSEIYLEHGLSVYQAMPQSSGINRTMQSFYEFLPGNFTYTQAVKIGEMVMNVSDKTVYNYLKDMKEAGWILQSKMNGPYVKHGLQ